MECTRAPELNGLVRVIIERDVRLVPIPNPVSCNTLVTAFSKIAFLVEELSSLVKKVKSSKLGSSLDNIKYCTCCSILNILIIG